MKPFSYEEIYKIYKHGGSLKGISNGDIFNTLKRHNLQVVLVYDSENKKHIYNFIPEKNRFYKII